MKILTFLREFTIIFVLTFFVCAIVSYFYSLIVHGNGSIDWEVPIRFAIIFGIIFPSIKAIENRRKD